MIHARFMVEFYPTVVPSECCSNRESRFDVILSVSEESRISSSYEAEILRLLPHDDTGTQSRRRIKVGAVLFAYL